MPLKRAMTKRKRMWGVFTLDGRLFVGPFETEYMASQYVKSCDPGTFTVGSGVFTWTPKPSPARKRKSRAALRTLAGKE